MSGRQVRELVLRARAALRNRGGFVGLLTSPWVLPANRFQYTPGGTLLNLQALHRFPLRAKNAEDSDPTAAGNIGVPLAEGRGVICAGKGAASVVRVTLRCTPPLQLLYSSCASF